MATDPAYLALQNADLAELGARIRETRRQSGLTQGALADGDVSTAYISRIEAGQRRPEFVVAQRIASKLGVSIEYLASGIDPVDAREALLTLRYAELAVRSGEPADAIQQLEALRDGRQLLSDRSWELLLLLGSAREALGDLDGAARDLEEALALAAGTDALQVAIALCRCYREAGDLARSIQVGEHGRDQAAVEDLLGVDDEIRLTLTLAAAYHERGDVVYASQLCQQAINRAEENASPTGRAAGYWNASVIAAERGRYGEALGLAERAIALLSEGDDLRSLARLKLQFGAILLVQDPPDFETAIARLGGAREDLIATGAGAASIARCDTELARAYYLRRDVETAVAHADRAIEQVGDSAPFVSAEAFVVYGRIAADAGDLVEARRQFTRAATVLSGAQADREVAQFWYQLGELLQAADDDGGARDAFRRAGASLGLRSTAGAAISV